MHPKIAFPGVLAPIIDDLSAPLHQHSLRDVSRTAHAETEVSLANGFSIEASDFAGEEHLEVLLADLREFMRAAMETPETNGGFPIRLVRGEPGQCPPDAVEAHAVETRPGACTVTARNLAGLRRAIFFVQDEMSLRRAPILPKARTVRWTRLRTRISRSPIAPYRWMSGWELEDENDYYPDAYLARLAHSGVNGVWVSGLLRNLVASPVIPELGPGATRLEKLRQLIGKTARYGIKVYLFCIEPRALPDGHPAAAAHPEIVGAHNSLCPSAPIVLEYVRQAMRDLFAAAPDLAGVINIFNSERATTCWMNDDYVQDCPRCRARPKAQVLGETLDAFADGIRASSSTAEFMAWTYMMDPKTRSMTTLPIEPMLEVMRRTSKDVAWLGNFEHGGTKEVCGKTVGVHEYALSYVGPSPLFTDLAREARTLGRRTYAKLQVGTSYELPSLPHIPVPGIVYDKLSGLTDLGASGAMLGWIPGGFPGPMLKAAGEAAFEPRQAKSPFLRRLAGIYWGEANAERVAAAWECFGAAWQAYPFNNAVLYFSPLARGPAYQLHLERETRLAAPYNWGYGRSRNAQPFEDQVKRWLGPYTVDEVVGCFRSMGDAWIDGVDALNAALRETAGNPELKKQTAVATALRIQCLSAADSYEFYALRDRLLEADSDERLALVNRMRDVAEHSLNLALQMKPLLAVDPAIGFHSEMFAYSYSVADLDAKIVQVCDMLEILAQWERDGVDTAVLQRTVEHVERQRPDRRPDRWGD